MLSDDETPPRADGLPNLPRPACTFADHSYPAFTKRQMEEYAIAARAEGRRSPGGGGEVDRIVRRLQSFLADTPSERWSCCHCGHVGGEEDGNPDQDLCSSCGRNSPSDGPDECGHCGAKGTMCSACPKCGGSWSFDQEEEGSAVLCLGSAAREELPKLFAILTALPTRDEAALPEALSAAVEKLASRHALPWVVDWRPTGDPPEAFAGSEQGGVGRSDDYEPCGYDDADGHQIDTLSVEFAMLVEAIVKIAMRAPPPPPVAEMPGDVVRLVKAAREVHRAVDPKDVDDQPFIDELGAAVEPFDSRVPWEHELASRAPSETGEGR